MAWNKPSKKPKKISFISEAPPYPLIWPDHWPRLNAKDRLPAKDNVTHFLVARDYILNELKGLRANNILISSHIPAKKNGELFVEYLDRKLDDPGVAVYFFVGHQPYVMACDGWEYPKDNLRAIGVTIGHIRACERTVAPYYLDIMLSAFAIPIPEAAEEQVAEPESIRPAFKTKNVNPREWWTVLGVGENASLTEVEASFRTLARAAHPDLGGSAEQMKLLTQAVSFARQELKNKKTGFFTIR
ncbi:MAG: J domain-containing protein [Alphaproteobacteria bacterium]|nr:MAG: J domain-containing protein [Alphaproteobacteria bacterium]